MTETLHLGQVEIPDWSLVYGSRQRASFSQFVKENGIRRAYLMSDIAFVRSTVMQMLYGESEAASEYSIDVVWPNGEAATWTFDRAIGYPIEDGEIVDWKSAWLDAFKE